MNLECLLWYPLAKDRVVSPILPDLATHVYLPNDIIACFLHLLFFTMPFSTFACQGKSDKFTLNGFNLQYEEACYCCVQNSNTMLFTKFRVCFVVLCSTSERRRQNNPVQDNSIRNR
mmetsp:Transcript_28286/g.53175  ORF Transcript_28286/g.53175 Transcript_28286/m.53175 type:complete len:117 (+) Transcript_28286:66-416(+)